MSQLLGEYLVQDIAPDAPRLCTHEKGLGLTI